MISDGELLRRYLETGAEPAFTELVQRHIDVVYHAALRRVGRNAHAADDVTQKVFTDLARKAKSLHDRPNLAGWLYTSTRFAAADVVRAEQRRRTYEEKAHTMHELDSTTPGTADEFEPFLDEVMDLLNEQDREAVLLHFFEGRSFVEVGAALSLSADATRMRVNRALDRLHAALAQRGVTSTATALGVVLSSQSALAAPASLALQVAGHALSHAGSLGTGTSVLMRLIQAAKSYPVVTGTGAVATVAIVGFVLQTHRPSGSTAGSHIANSSTNREQAARSNLNAAGVSLAQEPLSEIATAASRQPEPTTGFTGTSSSGSESFGSFSEAEKNILGLLWNLQRRNSSRPGLRYGIKLGELNSSGIDPLVAKNLVEQGQNQNLVHLTPEGLNFCEGHSAEIEAHPISAHIDHEFSGLSTPEKTLLKMLWVQQTNTIVPPGVRVGFQIKPTSRFFRASGQLREKSFTAIAQKNGMIYLTNAGRAFCETHLNVLNALSPPSFAGSPLPATSPRP